MKPIFRRASRGEAAKIASIVNRAYRPISMERGWTHEADLVFGPRTSVEQVLALLNSHSPILVVSQGIDIVACIHIELDGSVASLGMLATDPNCQNRGLGKQLLEYAEKYAVKQLGANVSKMSVLSTRLELISFYERRGYLRTGKLLSYPVSSGSGEPMVERLQVEMLIKLLPQLNTACPDFL